MDEGAIPAFPRGVRLRYDNAREQWVVLAPERAFLPDGIAVEILKLVDGNATLAHIIDSLAQRYAAPRQAIADDVLSMIADLADRKVLRLTSEP